jgi:hypothetical protein
MKRGDIIILLDASGGGASAPNEIIKREIRAVIRLFIVQCRITWKWKIQLKESEEF